MAVQILETGMPNYVRRTQSEHLSIMKISFESKC